MLKQLKIFKNFNFKQFIIGFGSILDISGNYLEIDKYIKNKKSDSEILYSDWEKIAQDFTAFQK